MGKRTAKAHKKSSENAKSAHLRGSGKTYKPPSNPQTLSLLSNFPNANSEKWLRQFRAKVGFMLGGSGLGLV